MRLAPRLVAALLVGGALAQEGEIDCKRMKAKELRQMLAARGVKCEGCAEKVPSPESCVLGSTVHDGAASAGTWRCVPQNGVSAHLRNSWSRKLETQAKACTSTRVHKVGLHAVAIAKGPQ